MYEGYVSVDLGRQHDYTAVLVAEEALWVPDPPNPDPWIIGGPLIEQQTYWQGIQRVGWTAPSALSERQRVYFHNSSYTGTRPDRPPLLVRHIERVRGRPYTQIVDEIASLLNRHPLSELSVALLVDAGGVGVAVLDLMRQRGLRPWSITATGGDHVNVPEEGVVRCPKRELVAAAQIMLAQGRLRIAGGLTHAATLTRELTDYQVKISASGHDSYSAREGAYDDLVYACAQLCWFRDWYAGPTDDHIAEIQRAPAPAWG